jgi:hypothetical protein
MVANITGQATGSGSQCLSLHRSVNLRPSKRDPLILLDGGRVSRELAFNCAWERYGKDIHEHLGINESSDGVVGIAFDLATDRPSGLPIWWR